jgi:hypothetical protein
MTVTLPGVSRAFYHPRRDGQAALCFVEDKPGGPCRVLLYSPDDDVPAVVRCYDRSDARTVWRRLSDSLKAKGWRQA